MTAELCAAANDTGGAGSNINYFFCARTGRGCDAFASRPGWDNDLPFICYITWALIWIEWTRLMGSNFLGPPGGFLLSREPLFDGYKIIYGLFKTVTEKCTNYTDGFGLIRKNFDIQVRGVKHSFVFWKQSKNNKRYAVYSRFRSLQSFSNFQHQLSKKNTRSLK